MLGGGSGVGKVGRISRIASAIYPVRSLTFTFVYWRSTGFGSAQDDLSDSTVVAAVGEQSQYSLL